MSSNDKMRIKILFISHSPHLNGAEIVLFNILNNIDLNVFEPIVIFPGEGPLIKRISDLKIQTIVVGLERWIRFKSEKPLKNSTLEARVEQLCEMMSMLKIDLVVSNSSVVLEGAIAARLSNVPHIWHIHENLHFNHDFKTFVPLAVIYYAINYLSKAVISVSEFTSKQFMGYIKSEKIRIIHNGVEDKLKQLNDLPPTSRKFENKLRFVAVGTLTESKGYKELLESAKILKERGLLFEIEWIGNSNKVELKKFKRLIKNFGLKEIVSYTGFHNDVDLVLKKSDVFICCSRTEAFPMSILEAMSTGLAVITTDCGGTKEAVRDGVNGFVVPVNHPVSLANRMQDLILDESLTNKFRENGYRIFKEQFVVDRFVKKCENVYLKSLEVESHSNNSENEIALLKSLFPIYQLLSDIHWRSL